MNGIGLIIIGLMFVGLVVNTEAPQLLEGGFNMKKLVIAIMVLVVVFGLSCATVNATSKDESIVKSYVNAKYDMPVKFVKEGAKVIEHREGKPYVVVEVLNTKAKGGWWGLTKRGYDVKYCKKDRKGKKVKVYLIYSPYNNACDDVVCMVDHGKKKGDPITKMDTFSTKFVYKIHCPACGDGTHKDCPYWYIDSKTGKGQHMTDEQIEEFEKSEARM